MFRTRRAVQAHLSAKFRVPVPADASDVRVVRTILRCSLYPGSMADARSTLDSAVNKSLFHKYHVRRQPCCLRSCCLLRLLYYEDDDTVRNFCTRKTIVFVKEWSRSRVDLVPWTCHSLFQSSLFVSVDSWSTAESLRNESKWLLGLRRSTAQTTGLLRKHYASVRVAYRKLTTSMFHLFKQLACL